MEESLDNKINSTDNKQDSNENKPDKTSRLDDFMDNTGGGLFILGALVAIGGFFGYQMDQLASGPNCDFSTFTYLGAFYGAFIAGFYKHEVDYEDE
ncbi:hypothetical protein GF358_02910 [Candidatus Woesearchaeota archaeon]|nr:hypothetical protein [Candidatus Woesearchaeota archaeon]